MNMGKVTSKIRYDFWKTLTEQYSESYYQQIREWCDANGVLFTGHLLGEEWLWMHARCEGNIFKHLKHMHITGVDHLYPIIGSEKAPDQHVAIKIASSAAHHFGSSRLLCESMGGTYWDCTLERMKWIANWEFVLGVTIFNNHGYHYSIEGERKRDWPPSQFYHHTWWKYYNIFTEYIARLGHILSGGKHVAQILILYPINSAWTNYKPSGATEIFNLTQNDFNYLTDTLLRLHFDFDYSDEDILSEAVITDGKIRIKDEEYSLLILPPITHIQSNTFQKIIEFVDSGGKVIADTLIPLELLDDKTESVEEIEKLFGINPENLFSLFKAESEFKINHKNTTGDVYVIEGKGLHKERPKEELRSIINECLVPDVTIDNENVFYLHRIKDNFDIYFFVNTLQQSQGKVNITFEKVAKPEYWDSVTGEIKELNTYRIINGRLSIELEFNATESKIVVLKQPLEKTHLTASNLNISSFDGKTVSGFNMDSEGLIFAEYYKNNQLRSVQTNPKEKLPDIILSDNYEIVPEDDNVLCIKNWKMQIENEAFNKDVFTLDFDDSNWLNVTMGAWEMQLPQERGDETFPVNLNYRIYFTVEYVPENLRVLIDGFSGSGYELFLNGKQVEDKGKRSKIDAEIKEINISEFVRKGKNVIGLKIVAERRTDGLLDFVKIVGDFSLKSDGENHLIINTSKSIKTGDWTNQGFPFYSGTLCYRTGFNLPAEYKTGILFLETDCGEDVLEISINDSDPKKSAVEPI